MARPSCVCFTLLKTGTATLARFSRIGVLPSMVCWLISASTEKSTWWERGWGAHVTARLQAVTLRWHRPSPVIRQYLPSDRCRMSSPAQIFSADSQEMTEYTPSALRQSCRPFLYFWVLQLLINISVQTTGWNITTKSFPSIMYLQCSLLQIPNCGLHRENELLQLWRFSRGSSEEWQGKRVKS